MNARARVRVRGVVQGVGFRPFAYGLAHRFELSGWVQNDEAGVLLEVQGRSLDPFLRALREELPPLARIDELDVTARPAQECEEGFSIRKSERTTSTSTGIGPDAAPCPACLRELFDPRDRRFRYPFLNCTHCGPRFTITERLPYDRATTSMASFPMCAACAREYEDPLDRRFHAQPIACPACGPRLSMPIEEIVAKLRAGRVVAIKGIGGFLLACDATQRATVARLREAKQRDGKPFAVMFASVASAARHVALDDAERARLVSRERPIVLARKLDGVSKLAPEIAPDLAWLGVMLPSSPLHHLLFHEAAGRPEGLEWLEAATDLALVMTSANPGGEPLIASDEEAARGLSGICDDIVGHDRRIVHRCDDPVVRFASGAPIVVRRGRGDVPEGIRLSRASAPVLAVGAHLKNAVCLTRGEHAYLSQHVGDMDDAATHRFFRETIAHLRHLLDVEPVAVAHDLHPDLLATRFAEQLGIPCVPVQHHHAHLAAVLAEHGREGPHVGLALDGTGLGTDGTAWGGELLRVDGTRFERLGHLAPLPLPGGDVAAREPWRMALAALSRLGRASEIASRWGARGEALAAAVQRGVNAPLATGCGRWFDAACGILGVRDRSGYEGEAPMVLESLVREPKVLDGAWTIDHDGVLDLLPLLDALRGMSPQEGADAFHGSLAAALVDLTLPRLEPSQRVVVIGGGCVVNAALTGELVRRFSRAGVEVLLPRRAPAGDGGLALGQAWVGAHSIGGL
ncbi:MAG: carbamoyltransferase HypF [Deltaproteobacteria bacterium]|nr:carbamoyltransferase HypF [Deltaproteobacteria bacterium]